MPSGSNRDHGLDGLRGLAALGVVVSHFVLLFFPALVLPYYGQTGGLQEGFPLWLQLSTVLYSGAFEVMVFFVLSGYVLALPFWDGRPDSLVERLLGRYLRLNLPVVAVTFLSFGLCVGGLMFNQALGRALGNGWFESFFRGNTLVASNAFRSAFYHTTFLGSRAFDPPLWSVRYEFLGSVILLGFLALLVSRSRWLLLLPLVLFVFIEGDDRAYYGCFYLGAMLGGISAARFKAWVWPLLLAGLVLGSLVPGSALGRVMPAAFYQVNPLYYHMFGAFLVVVSARSGLGSRFFQSRPIQYLGHVSFSLYLLHFLVLASAVSFWHLSLPEFSGKWLILLVAYLLSSLLVSHLFWRWVDLPSIAVARRFSRWVLGWLRREVPVQP